MDFLFTNCLVSMLETAPADRDISSFGLRASGNASDDAVAGLILERI